jgi:hypothetical protein
LAEFDDRDNGGNEDGIIDTRDAIFSSLRLWQDINHNCLSDNNELSTLASVGLVAIDLDYKISSYTDQYGNEFRYRSKVYDLQRSQISRWAFDVFLLNH